MSEKKIRRLRFDNLNGETPLSRLTVFLRRRNIRNLALLIALMLAYSAGLLFLCYVGSLYGEAADCLMIAFVSFSIMALIYLPVVLWLIILVLRPDKCYAMRRLRRLGDLEKFAWELEEDLAADIGVLFPKSSLCVTKRFIIEANLFCFRVYPLEGLQKFDCQKILLLPAFHYENGTSIKMVTRVPFHVLRPYIGPEVKINMGIEKPVSDINMRTEKPKLRKKDTIGFLVFICIAGALLKLSESVWGIRAVALCCCCVLMLLLIAVVIPGMLRPEDSENQKTNALVGFALFFCPAAVLFYLLYFYKLSVWGTYAAALYSFSVLVWLSSLSVSGVIKDRRLRRMLSEIKDPGERILKMEELNAQGWYKNRVLYLNQLSAVYYDKEDFKKALELIRDAYSIQSCRRDSKSGLGMTVSEMLRLNEIIYLTEMERFDEAEPLLVPFCDKQYKNSVVLYLINATRAQIAIKKGDTKAAREYLRQVSGLSIRFPDGERQVNTYYHLLLLEAECDLLEKDTASGLAKLDNVLTRSTWPPNLKRATELKEIARRKNNGLRRRRHRFRACQTGRHPRPRCAAAQRQAHNWAKRKHDGFV